MILDVIDIVKNPFTIEKGAVQLGSRRVRAFSQGHLVVDAAAPLLVWEHSSYPQYYFRPEDIEAELRPSGTGPRSRVLGPSELFDVVVDDHVVARAAARYPEAPSAAAREAFHLTWSAFDPWLEEDEIVFTHPRSPYVRVDALDSSRHVTVRYRGEVVADSTRPVVLFETGLVPRYYLPQVDVRMDLLAPTHSVSHCPYKGTAHYWSVRGADGEAADVVWTYRTPLPEAAKVAGLVAFWPEKNAEVEVYVDGERVGQPPGR